MKKINVGIIGHTGRLGKPLMEILAAHPFAEVVYTESRGEGKCGEISETEFMFLALPYGESEKYLSQLNSQKVIDLSIDHRNAKGWVYGLPEINPKKICGAQLVANPGCYATGIILGLLPLVSRSLIPAEKKISIEAVSGWTGSGQHAKVPKFVTPYKAGRQHQHIPEIEHALGLCEQVWFNPYIAPWPRGIEITIRTQVTSPVKILQLYKRFYQRELFIRVKQSQLTMVDIIETNFCDVSPAVIYGTLVDIKIMLDNLIKGGAGQAVQSFNLMCGFPETTGLI